MVREDFLHQVFSPEEALCAYVIGRSQGSPSNSSNIDYSESVTILNQLWHNSDPIRTKEQVRSLMRHCYARRLHLMDFLNPNLENHFRKILEVD